MQQIEMHKYYEKTICLWPTTLTISKFSSSNSTGWFTLICNKMKNAGLCNFSLVLDDANLKSV